MPFFHVNENHIVICKIKHDTDNIFLEFVQTKINWLNNWKKKMKKKILLLRMEGCISTVEWLMFKKVELTAKEYIILIGNLLQESMSNAMYWQPEYIFVSTF